jgi:hypothetical protein
MTRAELREGEAPHDGMRDVLLGLAERLGSARERYNELGAWRSREVASVEIASGDRLSIQPFYYERHGWRPSRLLKMRPRAGRDFVEDFFDTAGRWIATCEHTTPYGYYEEFFEHSEGVVQGTRFDYYAPDKKPINVSRASFSGDLIVDHALRGQDGWWYEVYRRDNRSRIAVIECVQFNPFYHESPASSLVHVEYGRDGLLEAIVETWERGGEEVLYRRPTETPEGVLVSHIVERLAAAIPRAAASLARGERAYCVALEWNEESDYRVPPSIAVGLDEQRQEWLAERGTAARDLIWSLGDFVARSDAWLDDPELEAACEELRLRLRQSEKWTLVPKLLAEVTARLRELEWSRILDTTDDFVVFETDTEGLALRRALKKAATPEQWMVFKARGWA